MQASPHWFRAQQQMLALCEQWRALTHAEGEAIRRGSWPEVARLQETKRSLQDSIRSAREEFREGHDAGDFKALIGELIQLESRNQKLLDAQLQRTEAEQSELDSSTHKLRQVKKAYVSERSPAWNSYS